jgi:hypothetical protein
MQDDEALIRLLQLNRYGRQVPLEMLKSLLPHLTLREIRKGEVQRRTSQTARVS